MASEMQVRNVGVDLAKCLAILFVIMHHIGDCGIRADTSVSLGIVKGFTHSFSYCCINLFALVSGYLGGDKLIFGCKLFLLVSWV